MSRMVKIDLTGPVLDFEDKPLFSDKPDATMAWCVAKFILSQATSGAVVKYVFWMGPLTTSGKLDLDPSDFTELRDCIERSQVVAILKGRLLIALDEAKSKSEI